MNCQILRTIINSNVREYKNIVLFCHRKKLRNISKYGSLKNLGNFRSCSQFSSSQSKVINEEDTFRFSNNRKNLLQQGIFTKFKDSGGLLTKTHHGRHFQSLRYFSDDSVRHIPIPGALRILVDSPPVEFVQNSLIWLHSTTGLPWWAVVVLTTFTARSLITLPCAIHQHQVIARIALIKLEMEDIVKQLKRETNNKVREFGWPEAKARMSYNRELKKNWDELIIRDNCHPIKGLMLILTQLPMWIFLSAGFRNLCFMLPLPTPLAIRNYQDLSVEGIGWITNLTAVDSFWILPITLGILNLINIELQIILRNKDVKPSKMSNIALNITRGVSIVMVPIAGVVPSCISLYWVTSSTYSLLQTLILVSPNARKLFRIPIIEADRDHPYQHLYNTLKNRLSLKNFKR